MLKKLEMARMGHHMSKQQYSNKTMFE